MHSENLLFLPDAQGSGPVSTRRRVLDKLPKTLPSSLICPSQFLRLLKPMTSNRNVSALNLGLLDRRSLSQRLCRGCLEKLPASNGSVRRDGAKLLITEVHETESFEDNIPGLILEKKVYLQVR